MAESSMALDADNIKTLADDTANAVADVNTTVTEISTSFDAMLETTTGHDHDGSNSKSVSAGIGALTSLMLVTGQIMGGFE